MFLQPGLHLRVFVRGVVIDDQVQVVFGHRFAINRFQKANPLLMTMSRLTLSDQRPVGHTQGGKQRRGAGTLVVVHQRA